MKTKVSGLSNGKSSRQRNVVYGRDERRSYFYSEGGGISRPLRWLSLGKSSISENRKVPKKIVLSL